MKTTETTYAAELIDLTQDAEQEDAASNDTEQADETAGSKEYIEIPTVVILGRPNVGKSTLFNKLTGTRRSIVGDESGITRDRIYGRVEWQTREFRLVDTGGIIPDDKDLIPANILTQARSAIEEASLILLVVDARAGITPLDEELAELARSTRKPVFVAANKVDTRKLEADALEFARWGFDDVFPTIRIRIGLRIDETGLDQLLSIDVRAIVSTWFNPGPTPPTALFMAILPEGSSFTRPEFLSTRAASGGPRIRITYALPSRPGHP